MEMAQYGDADLKKITGFQNGDFVRLALKHYDDKLNSGDARDIDLVCYALNEYLGDLSDPLGGIAVGLRDANAPMVRINYIRNVDWDKSDYYSVYPRIDENSAKDAKHQTEIVAWRLEKGIVDDEYLMQAKQLFGKAKFLYAQEQEKELHNLGKELSELDMRRNQILNKMQGIKELPGWRSYAEKREHADNISTRAKLQQQGNI